MNGRWSSKLGQSFFYTTFSDFHSCILHMVGWKITVDFVLWCEHRLFKVCQTIIDNQVTLLCTGNMRFTLYLKREAAKLSKTFSCCILKHYYKQQHLSHFAFHFSFQRVVVIKEINDYLIILSRN